MLLTVSRDKLGLDSEEVVEILDLRFDKHEAIDFATSQENVYTGYHMNKNNWITIILDGSMETEEIFGLIEKSYAIAEG